MSERINSYPSIYNMGHRAIADLLKTPVIVEEKVDGSQFSFGVNEDGSIMMRSKGAELHPDAPERMFEQAAETVKALAPVLKRGWVYRGEYLQKPKHNTLLYSRVPRQHIIIFDINPALETYLDPQEKRLEAERLGLECVPNLFTGIVEDAAKFLNFLANTSVLGNSLIEGVVVKPLGYEMFGKDKKCLMAKYVSEAFKEVHTREWKQGNPTGKDIIGLIAGGLRTPARWQKAVQHLAEAGKLENDVRDIGSILKEIPQDIEKECEEQIKAELFKWAWPHLRRQVIVGVPEWYKESLLQKQFETTEVK